ncbi:MAG: branched-chain amino acid ABC transporter permease [Sulfolobales archaeon]
MRYPGSLLLFIVLLLLPVILEGIGVARLIPILTYAYIMSIYALSFSLLLGYLGLLNFGHAIFFGLGAYVTTYQLIWLGIPYFPAIIVSASIGSLVGVAIAFIAKKAFRGVPFAFITLTLLLIVYFLYRRRELRAISGSEQGLIIQIPEVFTSTLIPIISILAFSIMLINTFILGSAGRLRLGDLHRFSPRRGRVFLQSSVLLVCLICIIYALALVSIITSIASRPGPFRISINIYIAALTILYLSYILLKELSYTPLTLAWIAVRDNEVRAETMGYNSFAMKTIALSISGALGAISGSLYILYSQGVNPDTTFSPLISVYGLIYSIIGGLYTMEGPIIGAILVTIVERYLSDYLGGWNMVVTGILFIVIMMLLPMGITPYLQAAWNKIYITMRLLTKIGIAKAIEKNEKDST